MISEFPLFVFSMLSGISAGAYVMGAVFYRRDAPVAWRWVFPLTCLVLLGLGLLAVLGHLQHPERFLNALANPTAMIAQEAYWSIPLAIVMALDVLMSRFRTSGTPRWLRIVGGVFAFGLMTVTSIAYSVNYGVPAWRGFASFPLFLVGDVAMGVALYAVFEHGLCSGKVYVATAAAAYALLAATLVALCFQFVGASADPVPVIAAIIIAPVGGLVAVLLGRRAVLPDRAVAWISLACLLIGVGIVRYAFYAAVAF